MNQYSLQQQQQQHQHQQQDQLTRHSVDFDYNTTNTNLLNSTSTDQNQLKNQSKWLYKDPSGKIQGKFKEITKRSIYTSTNAQLVFCSLFLS